MSHLAMRHAQHLTHNHRQSNANFLPCLITPKRGINKDPAQSHWQSGVQLERKEDTASRRESVSQPYRNGFGERMRNMSAK